MIQGRNAATGVPIRAWALIVATIAAIAVVACAGGTPSTVAQAPQQPASAAQPAPAAPAADPMAPVAPEPAPSGRNLPEIAAVLPGTAEEAKFGGTFRYSLRNDPGAGFDNMRSAGSEVTQAVSSLGGDNNLVNNCRDNTRQVCPFLAESWEIDDFTVYTFQIRDGVSWHDGTTLTAEDVTWWLNLYLNGATVGDKTRLKATIAGNYGDVQKVETLDGNRVRVTLDGRDPFWLQRVAFDRAGQMMHPRHLAAPRIAAGEVDVNPVDLGYVGAGPFVFDQYDKGVAIDVVRFDRYWERDEQGRQLPYLDGVEYIIIKEPAAMHAAFRTGRIDSTARGRGFFVPPEMLPSYRKSLGEGFWLAEKIGGVAPSMGFNITRPPFDDVRVRRAVSLWIDRQSAIEALGGGVGELKGLLQDTSWSNPDFHTWPGYNPATRAADRAEARRLLAEAGYANGLSFSLLAKRTDLKALEWWEGALSGLGVDLTLDMFDGPSFEQKSAEGTWQAKQSGVTGFIPEEAYGHLATVDVNPRTSVVHHDPRIAEFFDSLGTLSTLEERQEVGRELERYVIMDNVYVVATYVGFDLMAYRDYVKGLPIARTGRNGKLTSHATVWLDK